MKIIAITLFVLVGCAGGPVTRQPVAYDFPTCTTKDCEVKWSRALQWIQQKSAFGIRLMNDSMIETFPSTGAMNPRLAYRATKIAQGDGRYQIRIEATCGNFIACTESPQEFTRGMIRFIETGQ